MFPYPKAKVNEYDLDTTGLSDVSFGKDMLKEFGLDPDTIFLNHGSYGTVPKRVLDLQHRYNRERESHPDFWFRFTASEHWDKSRAEIARKINAHLDNVVLVENATSAINCSLNAFPFKAGDAVLDTTVTYRAIHNLCVDFTSRTRPDVELVHMTVTIPIKSEDDVIEMYADIVQKHPNIRVAIIDHITSPTAIVMPIVKLRKLLHQHGVTVIVDGAHGFLQLPLDMAEFGADIYTSNIHKWSYSPRGSAFLWFSDKSKEWLRPSNTSWLMLKSLSEQFFNQGTRDHVPAICARHGIQFYDAIGGMDKILNHTSRLANEWKQLLEGLGLESLQIPTSMESPNMKVIKLPPFSKYPYAPENLYKLQYDMFGDKMFVCIMEHDNTFWIRISTQIYNNSEDMKAVADAVSSFLEKNKD